MCLPIRAASWKLERSVMEYSTRNMSPRVRQLFNFTSEFCKVGKKMLIRYWNSGDTTFGWLRVGGSYAKPVKLKTTSLVYIWCSSSLWFTHETFYFYFTFKCAFDLSKLFKNFENDISDCSSHASASLLLILFEWNKLIMHLESLEINREND